MLKNNATKDLLEKLTENIQNLEEENNQIREVLDKIISQASTIQDTARSGVRREHAIGVIDERYSVITTEESDRRLAAMGAVARGTTQKGPKRTRKPVRRYVDPEAHKLILALHKQGWGFSAIARRIGFSKSAVARWARTPLGQGNFGGAGHKTHKRYSQETIEQIKTLAYGGHSLKEIANTVGVSVNGARLYVNKINPTK